MIPSGIRALAIGIAALLLPLLTVDLLAVDSGADCAKLRAAINDLATTFGDDYAQANVYLDRLARIESGIDRQPQQARRELAQLRREALLANPLLRELPGLLLVKRRPKDLDAEGIFTARDERIGHMRGLGREIGFPSNHESNSALERHGYDNEICVLSPVSPSGKLTTIYRPPHGGYVGELDLHWDADRILFTQSDAISWKLWEIQSDGQHLRQVSRLPDDVDSIDGCYLPNGKIVFASTASYQSVPCWHGCKRVANLYLMDSDGSNVRQLCFDQDHDWHPTVLPSGQILYQRWDYTGINHIFLRQLMTMHPDGTKQRAIYGTNSWFPNALFFPRAIPGNPLRLVSILSGYHGVHRAGRLVIVDPGVGYQEESGIIQRISGRGDPIKPEVRDRLVDDDWPKFLHPFPLSEKYFLVSACEDSRSPWRIYLADVFDNVVCVYESPEYALLEPTPLMTRPTPPVIPDQIDLSAEDAAVFVSDVYSGPGLAGVPRGTIKRLRVLAYHFGYPGLAGSDKIGYGGPWDAMRILGTVPVEKDGSASFRIPANTPIALQTLDAEGKAVQLMRSWLTAMPGEHVSCVGCHEGPSDVAATTRPLAGLRPPDPLTQWYGPARGFDFEREVQPALDHYCVSCHDGSRPGVADLRSEAGGAKVIPKPIGYVVRLHETMRQQTKGKLRYSPAYDELVPYIRRVGIEDDVSLLVPGEYHADTSELIQLLQKGHYGVRLDDEAWDRLITWIDLNGPCHGTWGDVFPIPDGVHERRMELRAAYGGPAIDPERTVETSYSFSLPAVSDPSPRPEPLQLDRWPLTAKQARTQQEVLGDTYCEVDIADGVRMEFVHIPAGRFLMGDVTGQPDEYPQREVEIPNSFWMSTCEVTNAQFRSFLPLHDSGYYVKRKDRTDGKGLSLNDDQKPAVRVSWDQAERFCEWLSRRVGTQAMLPTEEQWEYACRAGTDTPLSYGTTDGDFSDWGNMADLRFSTGLMNARGGKMPAHGATQVTGGVPHLLLEGAQLSDTRFDDGFRVTAAVGTFQANAWGLYDMHGNVSEWTGGEHRDSEEKYVRGGSFFDRPARCRSSFRLRYPKWQRVFNVGFRVVCEGKPVQDGEG